MWQAIQWYETSCREVTIIIARGIIKMFCPNCGTSNETSAKFCFKCGNPLPIIDQSAQRSTEPYPQALYKAVIGPKNPQHYLHKFAQFDQDGKPSATWHWPAFFVTFYWFIYRKMWLHALIYFFLPYLVMIPIGIVAAIAGKSTAADLILGIGYLLFLVGIFFLPPMYANALYYKHCQKLIAEAKTSSSDYQRQLGELSGKGGTSNILLIVILILSFISIVGILAAIAIPAYQDYTTRARVAQAYIAGTVAANSVGTYHSQHHALPNTIYEAGFTGTVPPSVREVLVNNQNGIILITMAEPPISGLSFSLIPSLDNNKQFIWACTSSEIQDKYLPKNCRK